MLRHDGKRPRGAASPFNSTMHFKRWSSSRRSSRWDRLHLGLMVLSRAASSTIRVLQSQNYFSWLVALPNLVLVKVSNRLVFFQFLLSIPISFQFLFRFLLRTCRVFLGFMLHTRVFPKRSSHLLKKTRQQKSVKKPQQIRKRTWKRIWKGTGMDKKWVWRCCRCRFCSCFFLYLQFFGHFGFYHMLWYPSPSGVGYALGCLWCSYRVWWFAGQALGQTKKVAGLESNPMTCGLAIPQGDPFRPLVAAVWLSAGARFIRRQVGNALCRILILWTTGLSPPVPLMAWLGSPMLGRIGGIELGWLKAFLKRNSSQFTAGTQGQRTPLDQLAFDQASTHVLFLRIVTRGHPRTNADREQARTDLCRDRLAARV